MKVIASILDAGSIPAASTKNQKLILNGGERIRQGMVVVIGGDGSRLPQQRKTKNAEPKALAAAA